MIPAIFFISQDCEVQLFRIFMSSRCALGHIPGSVNVPLFSNEERAVVGTEYAESGRYTAIKAGLSFVGPRFPELLAAVEAHGVQPGEKLLIYCWRGGMRSGAVGWLLTLCGFQVCTLEVSTVKAPRCCCAHV
eukprot:SAG31_NODE_6442_length_2016_cov_6.350548_2_plen_133_part_00